MSNPLQQTIEALAKEKGIEPDVVVTPATSVGDDDPVLDRGLELLSGAGAVRARVPVAA